jgi:hypothetical protein
VRSYVSAATAGSALHSRTKSRSLGFAGAAIALLCALLAVAPAAFAAPAATTAYAYSTSFGAGEIALPVGLQIDNASGNLLLGETGSGASGRIVIYEPDALLGGTPVGEWSFPGINPGPIAYDSSAGVLYAEGPSPAHFGAVIVERYVSDGAPVPTFTKDPNFVSPEWPSGVFPIAVDPTTHQVLMPSGTEFVTQKLRRLNPASGAIDSYVPVPATETGLGHIAVGLDGTIYVSGEGSVRPRVIHLTASGDRLPDFTLPHISTPSGGTTNNPLAIDPVNGNVVVENGGFLVGFTAGGEKLFDVEAKNQTGGSIGIAIGTDHRLYDLNPETQQVDVYAPAPYPGVETPVASGVTTTGFHVSTEVDPGAGPPAESTVHFEYSTDGQNWTSTPDQAVGTPGTFGDDIAGLEPNVTYKVRAVAKNSLTTHVSAVTEVTTAGVPPATETAAATDVGETTAVLNGTINPVGLQTTYHFEYGETPAYGSRVPVVSEGSAGGARAVKSFSRKISGLAPGTTYHFRLVATSSAGTAAGVDRTFTTVQVGGIPARAYEQVTPADKHGVAIIPRLSMTAAANGEGITYITKAGSQASPLLTREIAVRGATDWQGKIDIDPPLNLGRGGFLLHPSLAISSDYAHAFVVSNRALTPGGTDIGANLYKLDVTTGQYHLIAATDALNAFNEFVGANTSGTFAAGASDFSWIVFYSPVPLIEGAPQNAMYRWTEGGGVEVISVLLDGKESPVHHPVAAATYSAVSADGSRVYYAAFGSTEEGVFLREAGGAPKAISVSHVSGGPAGPQRADLFGVTKDGRYAFFVCSTPLTEDAPGEEGDLYRYDALTGGLEYLGVRAYPDRGSLGIGDDGRTIYFDQLEGSSGKGPFSVWHDGVVHAIDPAGPERGTEFLSPNGRFYPFRSGDGAVRLYDAVTEQTSCASCLPDGTPVPGSLPEGGIGDLLFSNEVAHPVTDYGTLFFDTGARLVAADVNGTLDVYMYRDGVVRLVSPGNRPFDAQFADASANGNDVFFTTGQKLVGRDNDESVDIYDARVGGGLPIQNPPPSQECLRDDCKATPNAGPELPFGGSEALSGPGNVTPTKALSCGKGKHKGKVKGKAKCVKKKHKPGKHKTKKDGAGKRQRANQNQKGGNR